MKNILKDRARRWSYDGWGLAVKGSSSVLKHTICTTRQEAREIAASELFRGVETLEIVKVIIDVRKA